MAENEHQESASKLQEGIQSQVDPARLFRREATVSDNEHRIEVANAVTRHVAGDEEVELESKFLNVRGEMSFVYGSRDITVEGDYRRYTEDSDIFVLSDGDVKETVRGGVEQDMHLEAEFIVGGGFSGVYLGAYERICAWADFLCWGGWMEVDVTRTEIASMAIRSMMFYSHVAGIRVTMAYNLLDDFTIRNENFGVFVDNHGSAIHLGGSHGDFFVES